MFLRRARLARRPTEPWTRARLLLLLGVGIAAILLVVSGLGLAVIQIISGTPADHGSAPTSAASEVPVPDPVALRDRIAAEPMLSVDADAAYTPDPALTSAGVIEVPMPIDGRGPAGVATQLPKTPEGAVAQLAAIEQQVLESMSLPVTREVWQAWTLPGAPEFEQWELTRNVQAFLTSARQGGDAKDDTTVVIATPVAGLVKGTDGPDWVVACVLLDVRAVVTVEARMGYGYCSRMQWAQGRWQIASGEPPAQAPSTWPGSQLAVEAGWLTWTTDEQRG
jgi:hypothetical protein